MEVRPSPKCEIHLCTVEFQQKGNTPSLADVFPHVLEFLAAAGEPKPLNSA